MKILHCADIHLGSKMESRLPKDKSDERKIEMRAAFARVVDYAKNNGIGVILLVGDVFDGDRPLKKDKEFFYSLVKNNPSIDFLYLRGNHDTQTSYTETPENLKTFGTEWRFYEYGDVAITGIECTPENATGMYATLSLDKNKKNIVMLHGQTSDVDGMYKVNLKKLKNLDIDYLALGHLHSFMCGKLDGRGTYAYPGCLEGRGFDECGQKGFIVLDTDEKITLEFVPDNYRTVVEIQADISGCSDVFAAVSAVKDTIARGKSAGEYDKKDIVRIALTGDVDFDADGIERELEKQLVREFYFATVDNDAVRRYDAATADGDISLRGEFIRTVLGADGYTDEQKQQIIATGLKALSGKDIEV